DEPRNRTRTVASTRPVLPSPPHADVRREYAFTAKLFEAGADEPTQIPKLILEDGQARDLTISDRPQNLLDKVILEENIIIGTYFDVRVRRLEGNKVRLRLFCMRTEVDKANVSEIRVLGNNVQTVQDVELRKPLKVVYQKDAGGAAHRWVEVTVDELSVDEQSVPAPAASGPQQNRKKH